MQRHTTRVCSFAAVRLVSMLLLATCSCASPISAPNVDASETLDEVDSNVVEDGTDGTLNTEFDGGIEIIAGVDAAGSDMDVGLPDCGGAKREGCQCIAGGTECCFWNNTSEGMLCTTTAPNCDDRQMCKDAPHVWKSGLSDCGCWGIYGATKNWPDECYSLMAESWCDE